MRSLNQRFRGKNQATDVLSFPTVPSILREQSRIGGRNRDFRGHRDAKCFATRSFRGQEVKILALHGILHLAGFDHERDNGEMARKEASLRDKLGCPSGSIERANPARKLREEANARRREGSAEDGVTLAVALR